MRYFCWTFPFDDRLFSLPQRRAYTHTHIGKIFVYKYLSVNLACVQRCQRVFGRFSADGC